jgi:hypothetical protein
MGVSTHPDGAGEFIATCHHPFPFTTTDTERNANARLIAAAPDLLAELRDLKAQIHAFAARHGEADFETGRAAAAIAKATGSAA